MSKHSRYNVSTLLVLGLVFHLVYIGSVFDCYFTSPVVNGMRSYSTKHAEAKRLVLIVGDGLRADLLLSVNAFNSSFPDAPEIVAPHLRSILESRGAFGISHTRVPTESRPGHVAIIGGMYEDVSAVTKGWKTNPVDFDSVFNQSSFTFSFGSPDILPMFSRGATPGKVKTWSYDEEDEDFTKDATALDIWVLDRLRDLFHNATTDATLNARLRTDKVVFFLHLLGLDTTGHSYRPHSREYMNNTRIVDSIVHQTENLVSEFYGDQETAFVFTADHGMSVIGNHGDGHPDSTRTPLIAWGKGVRGPLPDSHPSSHDAYSASWNLNHLLRRDVEQADIAALMSALLGTNWPVNSVGVLPDVDPTRPGYLNPKLGDEARADAALVNAKVILEHYRVKHEMKRTRTLFYKPFLPLEGSLYGDNIQIMDIKRSIRHRDWYAARRQSAELIRQGLDGLQYLQTYERLLIRGIVVTAYSGWAAYASLYIFRPLDTASFSGGKPTALVSSVRWVANAVSALVFLGFWGAFAIQRSPWSFYLYIAFPCYFWREILVQAVPPFWSWWRNGSNRILTLEYGRVGIRLVGVIGVLQAMVLAYTHRSIWSAGFVLIGLVWPAASWSKGTRSRLGMYVLSWPLACLGTAIFPLLAVDRKESLYTILGGGVMMLIAGGLFYSTISSQGKGQRSLVVLFAVQAALIVVIMLITADSIHNLQAKKGLPPLNQASGWAALTLASSIPFLYPIQHSSINSKLLMYFLSFGACFVILSISVEGLFYVAYSTTLALWVEVETVQREVTSHTSGKGKNSRKSERYQFQMDDLRIALFFLFFVQVGFFGTGNVASISSFYLEPVYRLIPIFSPFFMAALLIFKIIAPYVMLAVAFAVLNHRLHLPPFSLFLVALTLTDGMTLTFFFNVTDTGSWLEIGQSISFFCITSLLLLWSAGVYAAGEYLMADVLMTLKVKAS